MKTASKTTPHSRVSLRHSELAYILGALAETMEEQRTPHTATDGRRIARLHSRLLAVFEGKATPCYAVRQDGAVVAARDPGAVVIPAHGLATMLRQMGAAHG